MRLWRQWEDFCLPLSTQEMTRDGRGLEQECPVGTEKCFIYCMGRKVASPQFFWQQHLWLSRLIKVLKDCWGHANKPALRLWNRNKGLQTSTNDGQGRDYAVTVGLHGRTANQHKHGTSLSLSSLSLLLAFNSLPLSSSSSQQPTFVSDTVVSEEPAVLCSSSSALEVSVPLFWLCVCVCVFLLRLVCLFEDKDQPLPLNAEWL